jgi:mono/diheme cytochrome c family protein
MKTTPTAAIIAATLLVPVCAVAQESGNVGHGREIAQTICVACHVVARDQRVSPNSEAPPFPMIAGTPGMTSIALTAALLTSHRLMPNLILETDERRDVIAYILSLK